MQCNSNYTVLLRSFSLLLVLPLYIMASLGLFNSNLTLLHRASFQSYVKAGGANDLTVFVFSKEEFDGLNWTEKEREFSLNEKMFDVASIERSGDEYVVTCKHDVVESLVVNAFSYLKKANGKDLPIKKRSRKNFSSKHFAQKILNTLPIKAGHPLYQVTYSQKLTMFFDEVESPPPEIVHIS